MPDLIDFCLLDRVRRPGKRLNIAANISAKVIDAINGNRSGAVSFFEKVLAVHRELPELKERQRERNSARGCMMSKRVERRAHWIFLPVSARFASMAAPALFDPKVFASWFNTDFARSIFHVPVC